MGVDVAGGFEKIEKKSKNLALGSAVGWAVSSVLGLPDFIEDVFGFFTKLGLLGRVTGWTGKKVSE